MIEIQITNSKGQKFLMKGEEFVDGFKKYKDFCEETLGFGPYLGAAPTILENYIATYEEEVKDGEV